MKEWTATIRKNRSAGGGYFVLTLGVPRAFPEPKPGSFAMLSVGGAPEMLLRRPMAFFDFRRRGKQSEIDILYAPVGKGTRQLGSLGAGAEISLLGPIGNGFSYPKNREKVAVVAGGIGIAPFLLWAKGLSAVQKKNVRILLGFRDGKQMAVAKLFVGKGVKIMCAVEQQAPRTTFQGNAVQLLEKVMPEWRPDRILTCGPDAMMKAVVAVTRRESIPCEASLEAKMGCGVGACLSCVTDFVPGKRVGYALVCQDGPVFEIGANLP